MLKVVTRSSIDERKVPVAKVLFASASHQTLERIVCQGLGELLKAANLKENNRCEKVTRIRK